MLVITVLVIKVVFHSVDYQCNCSYDNVNYNIGDYPTLGYHKVVYTASYHTDYHKAWYDNVSYHIADDHTFSNHKVVYNATYHSNDCPTVVMISVMLIIILLVTVKLFIQLVYHKTDYDSDSYHRAKVIYTASYHIIDDHSNYNGHNTFQKIINIRNWMCIGPCNLFTMKTGAICACIICNLHILNLAVILLQTQWRRSLQLYSGPQHSERSKTNLWCLLLIVLLSVPRAP